MISKRILKITLLNEPRFIFFHTIKWFHLFLSPCVFSGVYMEHPFSSIDTNSAWKNFHKIDNLSIEVYAFLRRILTSLSVDETLLPKYINLSTNFKGLPLRVEMAPSCLKHMNLFYLRSLGG